MLIIFCLSAAIVAFLLLVPGRRPHQPFDWTKRQRWPRWRRWLARSAFPNDR